MMAVKSVEEKTISKSERKKSNKRDLDHVDGMYQSFFKGPVFRNKSRLGFPGEGDESTRLPYGYICSEDSNQHPNYPAIEKGEYGQFYNEPTTSGVHDVQRKISRLHLSAKSDPHAGIVEADGCSAGSVSDIKYVTTEAQGWDNNIEQLEYTDNSRSNGYPQKKPSLPSLYNSRPTTDSLGVMKEYPKSKDLNENNLNERLRGVVISTTPDIQDDLLIKRPTPSQSLSNLSNEKKCKADGNPRTLADTWSFEFDFENEIKIELPQLAPDEYNWRLSITLLLFKTCFEGETNFHCVVIADLEDFALVLIELVVSYHYLDVKNNYGQSLLHVAVVQNMPGLVRRILAHGATPDVRDHHGNTPLHVAVAKGHHACVEALTRHLTLEDVDGIPYTIPLRLIPQDLCIMNAEGETVIHIAVKNSNMDTLRYLVKNMYTNVNIQEGKSGRTALHIAVELGDIKMVCFLLEECDANLNAITYDRRTPLDVAVDKKNYRLIKYLLSKGGRNRILNGYSDSEEGDDDDDNMI